MPRRWFGVDRYLKLDLKLSSFLVTNLSDDINGSMSIFQPSESVDFCRSEQDALVILAKYFNLLPRECFHAQSLEYVLYFTTSKGNRWAQRCYVKLLLATMIGLCKVWLYCLHSTYNCLPVVRVLLGRVIME
jgi:hypothetical protein